MGNLGDVDFMYLNENNLSGSIPDSLAGLLDAVSPADIKTLLSIPIMQFVPTSNILLSLFQDDLFLFGNQLTGTIPEGFGNLVDLVNLYLHDNLLSGSIPTSLAKLKRLQRLYLNDNKLSGEIPSALANIIGLERT